MTPKAVPIALAALSLTLGRVPAESTVRAERRLDAMGTELSVVIDAPRRADALLATERAVRAVRDAEARLSTWDPTSELTRLNTVPARTVVPLSEHLARDLAEARACADETGGAFTPGMGALVDAWGLRTGGRRPSSTTIEQARSGVEAANLILDGGRAVRLDEGFIVEEGAFGKGVALDDAIAAIARTGARSAVLDLGGQVAVWGDTTVSVGIADPQRRDRPVLRLDTSLGSVATTGNSERAIVVDGERLGHVLDPATGRPVRDFGSVTVWAERAARADCLSTGLYVKGPERALDWAADHPEVGVVVLEAVRGALRARASSSLRGRLSPTTHDIDLEFWNGGESP